MNYTKGEWKYKKGSFNEDGLKDFGIGSICCNDGTGDWHIAMIHGDVGYPENVSLANAHLIAAAPEMYEALRQALLDLAELGRIETITESAMVEAKNKAEGK